MQAIGNKLANSIWELNAPLADKPNPDSSRFGFIVFYILNYIILEKIRKLGLKLNTSKKCFYLLLFLINHLLIY